MPRETADVPQTRLLRRALSGGQPLTALVEPLQDNSKPEVRVATAHLLHLIGGTTRALTWPERRDLREEPLEPQLRVCIDQRCFPRYRRWWEPGR